MKLKMLSLAMILSLALSVMSCADSNGSDDNGSEQQVFALVNIPFDKFFEAETEGKYDAYSSATQKAVNGAMTYGTYHVTKSDDASRAVSDSSPAEVPSFTPAEQVTRGITYPVKINLSALDTLKNIGGMEVTDATPSVDVTTSGRGGTSTIRYSGKQNLFHCGDYSYYVLSEAPVSYKDAKVSGSNITFGKIKGNTKTIDCLYVTIEPGEAHHNFSPMITLYVRDISQTSDSGVPVTKLTFAEISDKAQKVTETDGAETLTEQNLSALRTIIATSKEGKSYGLTVLNNMFWGKSQMGFQAPGTDLLPDHELIGKEIESLKFVTEKEVYIAENIVSGKVSDGVFVPAAGDNSDPTVFVIPSLKATDDRTERAEYSDSLKVLDKADFAAEKLTGTYDELFAVINQSKYDSVWNEAIKEVLPGATDDMVAAYADMLKSSCAKTIYGEEAIKAYAADPSSIGFDCFFINGVAKIKFDGSRISGTDKSGKTVFDNEYYQAGELSIQTAQGTMSGELYLTIAPDAGEFKYFLMMPDTPESTYHTEFRYGSNTKDLSGFDTGAYAYWLAAGILEDADETMIKNVISLFCEENLAGSQQ